MALALHAVGRQARFEATFNQLRERWGDERQTLIAQVYAWSGDADAAFGWLDKAVEQETFAVIRQYASPFFHSLHTDPRWRKLLERVGRSPKQLAAVEFNVTLPPGVNVEE